MKRFALTGLTLGFMVVATAPAFALSDRFDDARQDNINRLSDSPSERLRQRFDDARQDTINRLTSSSLENLY